MGPNSSKQITRAFGGAAPVERTEAFFFGGKVGVGALLPGLRALEREPLVAQDAAQRGGVQLLDHPAPHKMGRQFPEGPHGERQAQVVRPRPRDLQHDADLFRRILGRPAGRFPRPQRREAAGVEPPNQLPHILFVEIQSPGNGSRPHPLPREGDHLGAPQIRCRLRRLQDPREPPALRERQFSNIQTHVNLLWLSRLSVLDTKCD